MIPSPGTPPRVEGARSHRAGDPELAAKGLRRRLMRWVANACPAWLREEREDICHEALMRALGRARWGEPQAGLSSAYLWKTAHSAVIDAVRRRRPDREVPWVDLQAQPTAREAGPLRVSRGLEQARAVRQCLAGLKPSRRRAVSLYLLGWSVPEASGILGRDRKATENLVYRGLEDLRRCLQRKGHGP